MHPAKTQDEDFSPRRASSKFLGSLNDQGEYTMTVSEAKKAAQIHLRLSQNRNDFVSRTKTEYYQAKKQFNEDLTYKPKIN